jgi:hypothetical protein
VSDVGPRLSQSQKLQLADTVGELVMLGSRVYPLLARTSHRATRGGSTVDGDGDVSTGGCRGP